MKIKKTFGTLFVIIGLLLIAAAFWITINNIREEQSAQRDSQNILEQLQDEVKNQNDKDDESSADSKEEEDTELPPNEGDAEVDLPEIEIPEYLKNPEMEMPTVKIKDKDYIGILDIPELGLSLPIMSNWSYPKLKISPCRYQGSAYLDNLIIMAHNYKSHFGKLINLSIGDEIYFTDTVGNVFFYRVVELETLVPSAVEEMKSGDWDLTLFTCTIGGATRVTVRCEREK